MGNTPLRFTNVGTSLLVAGLLCFGMPALAQSTSTSSASRSTSTQNAQATSTQNTQSTSDQSQSSLNKEDNRPVSDNHITRRDVTQFDQFLDDHPEIAEQLRKDPSLVDNRDFVRNHPVLQDYLRDNPGVRDELRQNPDALLRQEQRFDNGHNGRDRDTGDLGRFTRFMDSHREVAEQLRRDPSLVDNREFVPNHPDLQAFLQSNPGVRDQLRQDPNAFMQREEQFNRAQNVQDRDNRQDLAQFDHFLDSHREIAEQVRKDPSLAGNREFVQNHPALQDYLRDNPGVRDEIRRDPNAFMHQEDHFDSGQHWGDRDAAHEHMASFREFLVSHQSIRTDIAKDPSVVKSREYVQNHPDLDGYLSAHPEVRDDMMADPVGFVKGTQEFKNHSSTAAGVSTNGSGSGTSTGTSTGTGTSTSNPKPKR